MRQAQQNRRGRGRNNNNRKGQNPLTRSYESNGPDVKIRGTPSHIAEKYVTMARDALSSGDPVLAENYLQHAEHYNRIIMTYREQQAPQQNDHGQSHAGGGRHRQANNNDSSDDDQTNNSNQNDDSSEGSTPRGGEPQPTVRSSDREDRPERPERPQRRSTRRERPPVERERSSDEESGEQPPAAASAGRANGRGGRRTRYAQSDDQPEFLKRPVRRPRASAAAASDEGDADKTKSDEAAE